MQIKFSSAYWSGATLYPFSMPKDATVIDCFCVNDNLRIVYLCEDPALDMVTRNFKAVGDWEDGFNLGTDMAFVGAVQYSLPSSVNKMQLHLPGGSITEVPVMAPGQEFSPTVETYIVFEMLNGKEAS